MKIDGLNPLDGANINKPKNVEPVKGSSFQEILGGLDNKITKPLSVKSTPPVSQVPFIAPPVSIGYVDARTAILGKIENALADLGLFGAALANPDVSLQRLQPLMDELVARKDDLAFSLGSTSDGQLKGLLSDTLSLVMEQMSRYNTGYAA